MHTKTGKQINGEDKENIRPSLRMLLQGAGLATALLTFVFITMAESNAVDLRWIILPYIFVPAAGDLGGLIFRRMQPMRKRGGIYNGLSSILGFLLYAFLFAVSFVMEMNSPE